MDGKVEGFGLFEKGIDGIIVGVVVVSSVGERFEDGVKGGGSVSEVGLLRGPIEKAKGKRVMGEKVRVYDCGYK